MTLSFDNRLLVRQIGSLVALFSVLCVIIIYQFTRRSDDAVERERAQVMLRRIHDLEMAYWSSNGTYLPIDRATNGDILQLNNVVGQFSYRVDVVGGRFLATAQADLDGDGMAEIWQMDQKSIDPVLVQAD
jgi:type II secretory pathway pseudopilin PulG